MRDRQSPPLLRAATPTALVLLLALAACGGDRLDGLVPLLAARDGQTVDATHQAQYLVDFGTVPVGGKGLQTFYLRNKGRAPLTLSPPAVAAPFSAPELKSAEAIPSQEERGVLFQFSPTVAGDAQTMVTLASDGGSLTLRLIGTAREPLPTDCAFDLAPAALDFGPVQLGQSKTLSFRLVNKSANPCTISRLSLTSTTNDAFSIAGGAVQTQTLDAFNDDTVQVTFAPTRLDPSYGGGVQFAIGPPDQTELVSLTGTVPSPCPGALPDGSCPVATDPIYVNDASHLYTWNATTNQLTTLGAFNAGGVSVDAMTDIAIDQNGVMMGVAQDDGLYVIDPNDAKCTLVAQLDATASGSNGLTFLPDGTLVASGGGVWELDKNTGRVTRTLVGPGRYDTSGDIIGLPDGKLYWSVRGSGDDDLVRLDPATGATTVVGDLGTSNVFGLAYENGKLYGYTDGGKVSTVDPSTASVSQTRTLSRTWWGATTNPVTWAQ